MGESGFVIFGGEEDCQKRKPTPTHESFLEAFSFACTYRWAALLAGW